MHIAIVSQYYLPELGATQNRVGAFAHGLVRRGHRVTVICEQPNHPAGVFHPGYGRRPVITERSDSLTIHRLWVATSPQKTTRSRLAFYSTFAIGAAMTLAAAPRPDVVFASSPPLPGPVATALVARIRRIPFVLDVRDLWPAAAEALGELSNPRLVRALERSEQWLYATSSRVTVTSRPFVAHVDRLAGRAKSVHVPNGALDELLAISPVPPPDGGEFTVGYTGNLGIAQGLRIVLDAAERTRGANVRFVLVGDGPLASVLRAERDRRELRNVEFRPSMQLTELAGFMQSCHALLIPLGAQPLLADFVPSKLYDAMAMGRPAIVAATGEAAALVEHYSSGVTVAPENGQELASAVLALASDPHTVRALGEAGRTAAEENARSGQLERVEGILREAAVGSVAMPA